MKKWFLLAALLVLLGGAAALYPLETDPGDSEGSTGGGPIMDLSSFSPAPPAAPLRLLYIHHSVGGTLFCDEGPERGENCIFESHPNGGGLRALLTQAGYEVHEASYGSRIGDKTDLFDWLPKFRDQMDEVLRVDHQDELNQDGERNQIVVFKSCYPNSAFVGQGEAPGDPAGPELTVANAQASLTALLEQFAAHPDVLFVYMTAPLAPPSPERAWRVLARKLLGRPTGGTQQRQAAALARQFNNWTRSPDGWLKDYPHRNVVVFDYFDVLTNDGESNMLLYPTGGGTDSHPSAEGNRRAAQVFLPFLNRAVHRAGLGAEPPTQADASPASESAPETPTAGDAAPSNESPATP